MKNTAATPQAAPAKKLPSPSLLRSQGALTYDYDADGRLTMVANTQTILECYIYNKQGQRVRDMPTPTRMERELSYDAKGRLVRAGNIVLVYDARGNMNSRIQLLHNELPVQAQFPQNTRGTLQLFYGEDTRLDRVITPSGIDIYYDYTQGTLMPRAMRSAITGTDVFRYTWDGLRLTGFYNGLDDTSLVFQYASVSDRVPATATLYNEKITAMIGESARLSMEYNHVGSLKNVFCILPSGEKLCTKSVEYTAFGIPLKDSRPKFIFPLGFAGGLHDPFTGFVRFGVRDYDPVLGRFTCPDPARDFGRDGDFYDYCMDDPINYVDATGLWAFPALLGGKALALAIGGAGTWGAAEMADSVKSLFTGKESHTATQAAQRVSPMVAGTVAGSTLAAAGKAAMIQGAPAAAALAAQAGTAGGRAAMDMYRKNEATILEGLGMGKDFISGYGMPPSMPATKLEGSAHFASLLTYYENAVRASISNVARNWDETKHPRDSKTGEFINK